MLNNADKQKISQYLDSVIYILKMKSDVKNKDISNIIDNLKTFISIPDYSSTEFNNLLNSSLDMILVILGIVTHNIHCEDKIYKELKKISDSVSKTKTKFSSKKEPVDK